jgi:hypothetical protein
LSEYEENKKALKSCFKTAFQGFFVQAALYLSSAKG